MTTPSATTAVLPQSDVHFGYSHHQNYQPNSASFRANGNLVKATARRGPAYKFPPPSSNLTAPALDVAALPHVEESHRPHLYEEDDQTPIMPQVQTATTLQTPKKRPRSREPDWRNFYKNGLPKEIIVIDDSPPPRASASVEAVASGPRSDNNGANAAAALRHAAKKRKRDDMYDPIYHIKAGPSQTRSPHYKGSNASSTISTDRTTSAIQTTAATSLGSQYSNNGSRAYPVDDTTQPGQKRKRVATRQQLANEAKRREIEINGDAFTNYRPPPRPPIKAPEVNVKVMQDNSHTKNSKVDDEDGHYIVVPDTDLTERYEVQKLLGQGTFGKVVQARDRRRGGSLVAIKIIRSVQKYRDASRIELRVLSTLKANDTENRNRCIHFRDCFDYRGHICIVMDLMGQSVFDFLKGNSFTPFPNSQIQSFARQLFTSVAFLHDLNLIHTDLKPENILLCENAYQTFTYNRKIPSSSTQINRQAGQRKVLLDTEIRLIDFGSATFQDEYHSSVVSTRHYRAPEIILGLGWSYPCDIWSIGCILVEFFTGDALFQTHDNLEHLAMMESVVDAKMDPHLIQQVNKMSQRSSGGNGTAVAKYFKRMKLDYPTTETTRASKRFVKAMKKLEDIIPRNNDFCTHFLDLLNRIFVYDPSDRITAKQALQHPWFKEVATPDDGTEAIKIKLQREKERDERHRANGTGAGVGVHHYQ
ncbi:hypothetical protein V499_06399 [Pseudogymnoascus sp. VKM F-103]|uniref:dual-specificity kinase n=1 Tax=Pseudogymnoascus verrucosus TaxID=342668 RepID=A0A1B8GY20_9PEZI|nr:dual specificity protein kinase kns1 [Pseudogymnoascus verrucosus]KFY73523.1 hypothetical protein V499_06399 [Pseudogymnoascus sp. VKM F-103]OBU00719.1 dual specificity protein kinase kns1 [Pseudogymnoascus verrucosus]